MSETVRLTTAQAIIAFLKRQCVERDGRRTRFFTGSSIAWIDFVLAGGEELFTSNFGFTLSGGAPNTGITAAD